MDLLTQEENSGQAKASTPNGNMEEVSMLNV
jgi:hypothetical protein